jgi:flavin reductase (DIM6/NTAB) family NADH-FMN oxidoreductase RutF
MSTLNKLFKITDPAIVSDNFIKTIGDEWMLITAGTPGKFNTMTASWGAMGVLWNKPIAICFIRPTRYTFDFANENELFTLSFFTPQERKILNYCGSNSGRNVDKIAKTGLLPLSMKNGGISFEQARLILECRKIYFDDLKPAHFLSPLIDKQNYPNRDYHRFFIGQILNCYQKL